MIMLNTVCCAMAACESIKYCPPLILSSVPCPCLGYFLPHMHWSVFLSNTKSVPSTNLQSWALHVGFHSLVQFSCICLPSVTSPQSAASRWGSPPVSYLEILLSWYANSGLPSFVFHLSVIITPHCLMLWPKHHCLTHLSSFVAISDRSFVTSFGPEANF